MLFIALHFAEIQNDEIQLLHILVTQIVENLVCNLLVPTTLLITVVAVVLLVVTVVSSSNTIAVVHVVTVYF